jgi:hypothetical protein
LSAKASLPSKRPNLQRRCPSTFLAYHRRPAPPCHPIAADAPPSSPPPRRRRRSAPPAMRSNRRDRAGRTESGGRRGARNLLLPRLAVSAGSVGTTSSSPRGQIAGDRRDSGQDGERGLPRSSPSGVSRLRRHHLLLATRMNRRGSPGEREREIRSEHVSGEEETAVKTR